LRGHSEGIGEGRALGTRINLLDADTFLEGRGRSLGYSNLAGQQKLTKGMFLMEKEDRIDSLYLEEEMRSSYLSYAMSVIVGRALPDVRDGLKPVQRRILYAMQGLGLYPNKPYRKSARLVGEVLGKYHPHGDTAVYDALVRMAQDFSLGHPLVDGQGNFGSVDGDPPAAMRYNEVKLSSITQELLEDLDKETVDFQPNFDGSLEEPTILPAKLPNLLLNGSSGIAVGMATNIPPHNLGEVVDACVKMIEEREVSLDELIRIVKGPDFPTGGEILGQEGMERAYKSGKAKITLRGKVTVTTLKERDCLIIDELPYLVNKAKLVELIAELAQNNRIKGIKNLRDESDKGGIRVVIELSRGTAAQIVLNQLFQYTPLQITFGIILLALAGGKPRLLNLREAIRFFLDHRKDVVTRRTEFLLRGEKKRAHILEGLRRALAEIDKVIEIIKSSLSPEEAKKGLIKLLQLSEVQAQAILDMRLGRLTGLEKKRIDEDYKGSVNKIKELEGLLASEERIWSAIKEELLRIKEKYGQPRRTLIRRKEKPLMLRPKDLITKEDIVITITSQGYIKYTPLKAYRRQSRGGRGVSGMTLDRADGIDSVILANTHSTILFFTNLGRVYWAMAYDIPEKKRSAKGRAIVNFLHLEEKEKIQSTIALDELGGERFLLMATEKGMVKKTSLSAYSRPQKGGIIAIRLKEEDELIKVLLTSGEEDIILCTKKGKAILFSESEVRPTQRASRGVKGISLSPEDKVAAAEVAEENQALFTITRRGYGKRTLFSKYRKIKRGGKGVINIRLVSEKGEVAGMKKVKDTHEIIVITRKGRSIRIPVRSIPLIGRNTIGSRIVRLDEDDEVVSIG
jgi:DNA gyrase subunit A